MKTISTSGSTGITLSAADNPITVTASGTIDNNTSNYAMLGPAAAYVITNYGLLRDTTPTGVAVGLKNGGTIANSTASATIAGSANGVNISGAAGLITNAGTILSLPGKGVTRPTGISLAAGGSVTNIAGGLIGAAVNGSYRGTAVIAATSATVVNNGSITAGYNGIVLSGGGSISNAAGATISQTAPGPGLYFTGGDAIYANALATVTNAGLITATTAAVVLHVGGTVTNATGGTIGGFYGVKLTGDGSISNAAGATIGSAYAIYVTKGAATITNDGVVNGADVGVFLASSATGSVINEPGATIFSATFTQSNRYPGSGIHQGAGVNSVNAGHITGFNVGVFLSRGGTFTNAASGVINSFYYGVHSAYGAANFVNAGTIGVSGGPLNGNTAAVALTAGYANQMGVVPGAVFLNKVDGGNTIGASITSTIVAMSGGSMGTLAGFGTSIVNFGSVSFAPDASWLMSGNAAGIAGGEVFGGFAVGDTLQITGVANEVGIFNNGTLNLTGSANLSVLLPSPAATDFLVQNDPIDPSATDITLLCYAAGTRILTDHGEMPVEELREGDRLVVRGGGIAPLVWIGWREIHPESHPRPERVRPVRIQAHAFGAGMPHADLRLSPDHAVFVDGVLIPARLLINGASIIQEPAAKVTWFHLELPDHDIVQAEGLWCESYLNTGDRSAFANGGGVVTLHPDFTALRWEGLACAELVLFGPRLAAVQRRLADAAALGAVSDRIAQPLKRRGRA